MESKKNNKTIYYHDELNDDFANNITKNYKVSDNFKYIHKNIFFRFFAYILYHFIAIPIFYISLKIKYHVKVIGKENLKCLKDTGFFLYANHTQNLADAIWPQTFIAPFKNGKILANNDVYSLKGLNTIVNMLGCLPIPNNLIQSKKFNEAIKYYIDRKNFIIILPEAHIWPFYNDIRPFKNDSFIYPATLKKPVLPVTLIHVERKHFKNKKPYFNLVISKPIFPSSSLSIAQNQINLRNQTYNNMKENVIKYKSYEYIHYVKKDI